MTERELPPKPGITPKGVADGLRAAFLDISANKPPRFPKGTVPVRMEVKKGEGDRVPTWTERRYDATLGTGKTKIQIVAGYDPEDPYADQTLKMRSGTGQEWDYFNGGPAPKWVDSALARLGIKS